MEGEGRKRECVNEKARGSMDEFNYKEYNEKYNEHRQKIKIFINKK